MVSASAATPRAVEFPAPKVGFGGPPAVSERLADTDGIGYALLLACVSSKAHRGPSGFG
ncbi:hypothetical protein BOSEA31B_10709 [Hyphomicrobiales bacterium]|nr:hypothetical protein BOSEA31B_10709 [Hyphomicrobiales bacterium]CAH1700561.1 hypothetical protein BOSEA1005_20260 [Hyphomicrobiales bacterium]CAI0344409.1 hypothetical protein BO1005MUT1_330076 [Hyphomicrobiales bacterium]